MKGSDGGMPVAIKWAAYRGSDTESMWGPGYVDKWAAVYGSQRGRPDLAAIALASFDVMFEADTIVNDIARILDMIEGNDR